MKITFEVELDTDDPQDAEKIEAVLILLQDIKEVMQNANS